MKSTPIAPGSRYGRLSVLSDAGFGQRPSGQRYRLCRCRCDCGREVVLQQAKLKYGDTRSCGCLRRDRFAENRRTLHGKWLTPEFRVWSRMLERCQNPNHRAYHRYGGRGIMVCERWRHSFPAFLEDMGERPSPEHTLDRIDNDGDYSAENCRWATTVEQNRNRSDNHWVTFQGETFCLTDWAQRIGISKETLRQRLDRGWPVERALTEPLNR